MLPTDTSLEVSKDYSTLYGETISLEANGKSLVLYFFAPWCQVCHASIGNLQSIYESNPELDVIAVALDFSDSSEVERFTKQHKLTFPIVLGDMALRESLQVPGYPSYYVMNEQNVITSKSIGYSTELGIYLRSL